MKRFWVLSLFAIIFAAPGAFASAESQHYKCIPQAGERPEAIRGRRIEFIVEVDLQNNRLVRFHQSIMHDLVNRSYHPARDLIPVPLSERENRFFLYPEHYNAFGLRDLSPFFSVPEPSPVFLIRQEFFSGKPFLWVNLRQLTGYAGEKALMQLQCQPTGW